MGNCNNFNFRTSSVVSFCSNELKRNTNHCFCFCSGGTVDITVHEIQFDGNMKEVACPSGGPWGGKTVDENLVALLKQSFGDKTINNFINKKTQAWLKLMTTFDIAKRTFKSIGNTPLRFELGYIFCMEIL